MKDEIEPTRPWNTRTKLTPLVIADRTLDLFTSMPQRIENTYQACSIKESKDNVQATEGQCPGLALPEPNLFKLFRRQETARFGYWWDELRIKVGNKESTQGKQEFDDDAIWKSAGESLDGFQCAKDCENCYGEKGYPFPNAEGYKLSAIPVTSTYSADGTEIPWIREENWDKEKGFYRPRCECEPSYTEDTKQRHECPKGKKYSDNTMVCELVRNGGILNGCHQGRFVVSGIRERDGDRKCFLVEIDLTRVKRDLNAGVVQDLRLDYTRQCVRENIGSFVKSRSPTADRAVPTLTPLRKTCLSGWEESEMSSGEVTFCRKKADDNFETALKEMLEGEKKGLKVQQSRGRRLLQRRQGSRGGRRLLQQSRSGS